MKKKIIFLLLASFLIINFISIKNFFWNILGGLDFSEKNFIESQNKFEKTGNKIGYLNSVNSLFEQKKFLEAEKKIEKISFDEKNLENFSANFLAGNISYKLGEEKSEREEMRNFWTKSLSYYETALDIKFDQKVKENYEFVEKKLEELKTEEEKKEEQERQEKEDKKAEEEKKKAEEGEEGKDREKGDGGDDQEDGEDGDKGEKSNEKNETSLDSKKEDGNNNENGDSDDKTGLDQQNEISKEEEEALEEYQKQLEQAQKSFSQGFNKVYEEGSSDPFEAFFGNGNGGGDKKDW